VVIGGAPIFTNIEILPHDIAGAGTTVIQEKHRTNIFRTGTSPIKTDPSRTNTGAVRGTAFDFPLNTGADQSNSSTDFRLAFGSLTNTGVDHTLNFCGIQFGVRLTGQSG
jgi:hypothetical protein